MGEIGVASCDYCQENHKKNYDKFNVLYNVQENKFGYSIDVDFCRYFNRKWQHTLF